MRVLVTGARGKVGRAAVRALQAHGHVVTASDLAVPTYETRRPGEADYVRAELTDAGDTYALVRGHDAVVHAAAIPEPTRDVPHRVFANNILSTFNVIEASVRWGVRRVVNMSSETVPGFIFAERGFLPAYCPIDEEHPVRPQDPYALAKYFGEQLCDAAVARSDLRAITIRSSWVQWEGNYEANLGPLIRDPNADSATFWSYVDVYDLADAITAAVECDVPGHEVVYIAAADNAGSRDLAAAVRARYGEAVPLRPLDRPDASGISIAKARRLLGYQPRRSWRDYLDEQGRLLPHLRARLASADGPLYGSDGADRLGPAHAERPAGPDESALEAAE